MPQPPMHGQRAAADRRGPPPSLSAASRLAYNPAVVDPAAPTLSSSPRAPALARASGDLGAPSPSSAAGPDDTTAELAATASPARPREERSAEETRASERSAPLRGARQEPIPSEIQRSKEHLAETLPHESIHQRPVVDLASARVGRYVVLSKLGEAARRC